MLNVIVLSVVYAECRYSECYYALYTAPLFKLL
jgi:hypothetical protein